MFETLKNAFKVKEIRVKIWYTLLFLLIYRLGCYIPVPGIGTGLIDTTSLESLTYLNIMNMMTGGSLMNGTLFAMGIGPYINSSIIIQLLAVAIPSLERLSKQGEEGRKKIAKITRYVTLAHGLLQSIAYFIFLNAKNYLHKLIQKGAKNTINITNQHFLDNKILIPEKGWLDKIVKFAAAIEIKIATENKVLQTLQQQKDYLLSKMFI